MDDVVSRLVPGLRLSPALAWQVGLPLLVAVAGLVWRRRRGRAGLRPRAVLFEVGLIFGGLYLYKTARTLVESEHGPAVANAREIITGERALGLYVEPAIQELALGAEFVTRAFNANYAFGFQPLVVAALVWLYLVDEANYRLLRNGLGLSAAMAVATVALFPVAPPRLVPEADLVDTLAAAGHAISFTNQYAAVPSLHVGWLTLVGLALARSTTSWRRGLAFVPAVCMTVTVMATGNHYWFDALTGAAVALGAVLLLQVAALRRSRGAGPPPSGEYAVPAPVARRGNRSNTTGR